jgi:hypothetical protein
VGELSELSIQTLFRSRARMRCPEVRIVAVPNAGKRGFKAQRQMQLEGVRPGFPDIVCLWPGGGVAFIEFKAEKGRLSLNQVECLNDLSQMGFPAVVSRDPDHALEFLRDLGAPFIDRPRCAA